MKLDTNKALKSVKYNNVDVPLASGLNVFVQETQPQEQNGLWVKRAKDEVSKVLIKSDYYLADGEATKGLGTFKNEEISYVGRDMQSCIAIGKIIYTFGGNYYNVYSNGEGFAYDTETDLFTHIGQYELSYSNSRDSAYDARSTECMYLNGVISFFSQITSSSSTTVSIIKYDIESRTFSQTRVNSNLSYCDQYNTISGIKQVGNQVYVIAGTSSTNAAYKLYVSLYDLETETFTNLTRQSTSSGLDGNAKYLLGWYDGVLHIINGNSLVGTWDTQQNEYTFKKEPLSTEVSQGDISAGRVQLLNKVYLIGGASYTSNSQVQRNIAASILIYDLATKESRLLSNILPYPLYGRYTAAAIVDGTVYVIGGTPYQSDTNRRLNTVIKFAIQTNEFTNGTVVCQPSSKTNVTEMYTDKLSTVSFGIDDVYYQSAAGFNKQPAAIIKNGVATDIGGGGNT